MSKIHFREKHIAAIGLLFIASLCFISVYLLPTGSADPLTYVNAHSDDHDHELHGGGGARAIAVQKQRERDQEILRRKIEAADVIVPIPKPQIGAGDDADAQKTYVKEMMKFAWDGYRKYAWGSNELKPISKTGHSASVFGMGDMGATIIDAIDTLYLMGMKEEYEDARRWIELNLDFKKTAKGDLSVFETNIRFVGGLLSIYALTNDKMFLKKAEDIATLLLPAFDTPTGIPLALVNVATGKAHNYGWASGGCSILAEFGSLQLEFDYLSNATGNPVFKEKITKVRDFLYEIEKPEGMYPIYLHPSTGKWGLREYSMGAMADSWYEYLLKHWLITDKRDSKTKRAYDEAVFAMEKKMLFRSQPSNLAYFADIKGKRVDHKMDHLACFSAGMFTLQSVHEPNVTTAQHYLQLGRDLGDTCHESYARSAIGIGPESFRFSGGQEAVGVRPGEKYYILRPEVVEGWFYLWRVTREQKYRDWAWAVVQALDKHCKVEAGYSGIRDVYSSSPEHDDVQQSFLLAELFKYLFLIFSDETLPLDQWVLNTEAHAFPIRR